MRLRRAHIARFGPLSGVDLQCRPGLTVIYGSNESGKTLTVEALVRLLAPKAARKWKEFGRVTEEPEGFVVIERGGEEIRLEPGGGLAALDGSTLTSGDVRNVLVIRNSDLAIKEASYYGSLTERLVGVRLRELDGVKELLRKQGRLTPKLKLADDMPSGRPETTRDQARKLAGEMREYVERADAAGLDALEVQELDLAVELAALQRREEELEQARRAHEQAQLSTRLERARLALATLEELAAFAPQGRDELRDLEAEIAATRQRIDDLEDRRERARQAVERLEREARDLQAQFEPLALKAPRLQEVELAVREARGKGEGEAALRWELSLARGMALLGLVLGGLSLVWGAGSGRLAQLVAGAVLLGGAGVAAAWYLFRNERLRAAEEARRAAVSKAQDEGLRCSTLDEVGPAIDAFRLDLEQRKEKRNAAEAERNAQRDLEAGLRPAIDRERERLEELREHLRERLLQHRVDSVEAYAARVGEREEARRRLRAAAVLVHRLGTGAEEPGRDDLGAWQVQLDRLRQGLEGAEAQGYDESEHRRIRDAIREKTAQLGDIRQDLKKHRDQLRALRERAEALDLTRFVGEPFDKGTLTTAQLAGLAGRLAEVADAIDREAELARRAIAILEEVRQEQANKVSQLLDEGDRASLLFSRLTGGRYSGLRYEPSTAEIAVLRDGSPPLDAAQLSHGAFDQLYFAVRVALAEQLLGSEPGFFILDDAFLAFDKARLRQGFQTLQSLAQAGWSILYFTAKAEVGEELAPELGLPVLPQKDLL